MKVLFVTNMYPTTDFIYNGIFVKEQIDYLAEKYSLNFQLEFINGRKSKFNYIKSIFVINRMIRHNDFDIIHIHFGLSGLFLLFNPFHKTPSVVTLHGSDTKAGKAYGLMLPITKQVVKRVNRVIIMNENMRKLFPNYLNKLIKIPCGINIKTFDVGRGNSQEAFRIGFPGNKDRPGKNFLLFYDIVERLRTEGYQIEIIEFHNLTREQVVDSLSTLDCLLMTSLYEGSPQINKEAMVAGIPIVSTNVGDVKSVLFGVSNCYVVDSFSADQFLEPLRSILTLKREERITNGKERIAELEMDQDSVVSKIFNMYKDIINENKKAV